MLADSFGRVATDLRVSLTDRCNLRCAYCMPPEGLDWLPAPQVLTDDEIVRLVTDRRRRASASREVRFTGGEPLLRRGLVVDHAPEAALTPRPGYLADHQRDRARPAAARCGGRAWTGSTCRWTRCGREVFRKLARRDRLPDVLDALSAAAAAGLTPVKVNAVLMRGINDDEAVPLLPTAWSAGTSCGSSSRCRWTRSTAGRGRRWSPRARFSSRCPPRSPCQRIRNGPGRRPRRNLARQRRPGPGGRDRVGDAAVLRGLRPGPADRRRPGPQLPVRALRKRPAVAAAGRRLRRGDRRAVAGRGGGQAAGARDQRPVVPAARPPDVRDRRLITGSRLSSPR